jgi:hypothetical protein
MRDDYLLNDEQIREYICNGYLVLTTGLSSEVHDAIDQKLQWMLDEDYNPGNNILPRIPEMNEVIEAPEICGALSSVLGKDYVVHPHRFCHSNMPGKITENGPEIGDGSTSFIGWHQDSHSPLSRPRHHFSRYAMILYYPQDTPGTMGPTQLIPGTQYARSISAEDHSRGKQFGGNAGTCVLVHFDVAHGGSLNLNSRCRHMVKFVFARVSEPVGPSWNNISKNWECPKKNESAYNSISLWRRNWDWMCGESSSLESEIASDELNKCISLLVENGSIADQMSALDRLALAGASAEVAVPEIVKCLDRHESIRQNAIYVLAKIGSPAIRSLIQRIVESNDGWNEGAVVMEDAAYALGAMGEEAVDSLYDLLSHNDEWVKINALFALGELGSVAAKPHVIEKLAEIFSGDDDRVIRTGLDAVGQWGEAASSLLFSIAAVYGNALTKWSNLERRSWSSGDQVRVNAAMALLRLGPNVMEIEKILVSLLGDKCGYVDGFSIEGLLRIDTKSATQTAIRYLQAHRWDDTLIRNVRTF